MKNCTQIDNSIKAHVIKTVADLLLLSPKDSSMVERLEINFDIEEQKTSKGQSWSDWNAGGEINKIMKLIEVIFLFK